MQSYKGMVKYRRRIETLHICVKCLTPTEDNNSVHLLRFYGENTSSTLKCFINNIADIACMKD